MDIHVGNTSAVQSDSADDAAHLSPSERRRSRFKERRKEIYDRRRSVREGIFVSISVKEDYRRLRDRRRHGRIG
ncbi:MAG: hypothetical protein V1753_06480 [Pseudomonadota bacterium]